MPLRRLEIFSIGESLRFIAAWNYTLLPPEDCRPPWIDGDSDGGAADLLVPMRICRLSQGTSLTLA